MTHHLRPGPESPSLLCSVDPRGEDLGAEGSSRAFFAKVESLIDRWRVGGFVCRDPSLQIEHLLVEQTPNGREMS